MTSLESELGRPVDRAALCAETLAVLAARYDDLLDGAVRCYSRRLAARAPGSRGARVSWETPGGTQSGMTAGIDDVGALLVRVGDAPNGCRRGSRWLGTKSR